MPTIEEIRAHEAEYGITVMGAHPGDLRSPSLLGDLVVVSWVDHLNVVAAAEQRVREELMRGMLTSDTEYELGVSDERARIRAGVEAEVAKRGGYHSAREFLALVLAVVDNEEGLA